MEKEILKFCLEKGLLVDKSALDLFEGVGDVDSAKLIIEGFKEKTQAITRQVTDQVLNGLNEICQKDFTLSSGKYEVWIALEMPIENVGKSIYDKVSDDEKIRLDYDYEKFKDELQKEIEKKRNE